MNEISCTYKYLTANPVSIVSLDGSYKIVFTAEHDQQHFLDGLLLREDQPFLRLVRRLSESLSSIGDTMDFYYRRFFLSLVLLVRSSAVLDLLGLLFFFYQFFLALLLSPANLLPSQ